MRTLIFAAMLALAGLALQAIGPAFAEEGISNPQPQCSLKLASLQDFTAPAKTNYSKRLSSEETIKVAFCGQCTTNDDCGVGFKCAGRPECMECVKSP